MAGQIGTAESKTSRKARSTGTIIRETAAAWGIIEHSGCHCAALAAEMDSIGNDVLLSKIEEYTDKFLASIKLWKATGNWVERNLVPLPSRKEAQDFLIWAINLSKQEANN